ncbi:hypothetical protein AK812_SmicGene15986 [Symbiodinium microadriaticum]|uniref:Uncharacterized protein n=1 Tax=Symbiodinium microadriaticum TaxID=2951 RepID=A0A1Q9E1H9_SYMMI|nr:hypothetical protein AK812_SmicGene15986 [Symbiodinium microadriaticum]
MGSTGGDPALQFRLALLRLHGEAFHYRIASDRREDNDDDDEDGDDDGGGAVISVSMVAVVMAATAMMVGIEGQDPRNGGPGEAGDNNATTIATLPAAVEM